MPRKPLSTKEKAEKLQAMYDRQNAFAKENYKAYSIRLKKVQYADVIQKLESVPNKNDYVASLIRADIVKNGFE